jgi:hypothetical protein
MQEPFAGNGATCVFSSAFFRAGGVQIQASPKLWTSVLALVMCSFRGGLIGRMLARPAWPWSLFPMTAATCAAGSWFSQRGVAQRVDLITSVLGVQRALLYCISLRPVTGLFSPGVTSICCGSWGGAAAVLNHSAVCYPKGCSAQGSLPLAVVALRRLMGIMACTVGRRLA